MIKLHEAVTIEKTITIAGAEHRLSFTVLPPTRSYLKGFFDQRDKKEGEQEDFATPEYLLKFLQKIEGVEVELNADSLNELRECQPAIYSMAWDAVFEAQPQKVKAEEGN